MQATVTVVCTGCNISLMNKSYEGADMSFYDNYNKIIDAIEENGKLQFQIEHLL